MVATLAVGGSTCALVILSTLFFPRLKIKNFSIDSYWVVTLIGALIIICFNLVDVKYLLSELVRDTSVNPIKILTLFISMTVISVFLDEIGFFGYLASKTLKFAKNSQVKLFVVLYLTVSVLTVFTSNDIIVLTFTPFICYFSKNAKINALPYLVAEFVAANTMSMVFIIGNPTNIYLATYYGINFIEYFKVMLLPSLASFVTAFLVLFLVFRKQLKVKAEVCKTECKIQNKALLVAGLTDLSVCTVLLAIGAYIGFEMWIVSFVSALSLILFALIVFIKNKQKATAVINCVKRAPWQLVPFIMSMFTIILAVKNQGITDIIGKFLGETHTVFKYGVVSFFSANVINNIPMSVLFCAIISPLNGIVANQAVFATIVGSNLGAFLTPVGALAGIMWTSLLKKHGVKYSFFDFIKYGAVIALPTLMVNLAVLSLVV